MGVGVQDGPIHDAQWSPDGAFFVVVAGFMPAKTVLFDAKCKPVFDLGTGPYNIIKWNPQVACSVLNSLSLFASSFLLEPIRAAMVLLQQHALCNITLCLMEPPAGLMHVQVLQGRFLALCGFGNLPGDITFLDKKADGKCKVMGQVR